jgi:hypothetical protein
MDIINGILTVLGYVASVSAFVCWLIILLDAFKKEVWKGIVGLLCGLYLLYYAIAEFEHEKKWLIVLLWLLGLFFGTGPFLAGSLFRLIPSPW